MSSYKNLWNMHTLRNERDIFFQFGNLSSYFSHLDKLYYNNISVKRKKNDVITIMYPYL